MQKFRVYVAAVAGLLCSYALRDFVGLVTVGKFRVFDASAAVAVAVLLFVLCVWADMLTSDADERGKLRK